jgi:hypothetical protein
MKYLTAAVVLLVISSLHVSPGWADDQVTLKSGDGQTQLVLPAGWVDEKSSNSAAAIEGRDEDANAFVMVLIAQRTDPYATLDEYAHDRRNEVLSHLVHSTCSSPQEIQWNGHKAVQYEIHGLYAASKISFGYFLTIAEVGRRYVEVVGWAVQTHFADNAGVLKDAINHVTYKG